MPKRRAFPAALLILVIAITAAACGSSKGTATATRIVAPVGSPGPIALEIVSPSAGSTVKSPFTLEVRVAGVEISPWSLGVPGAAHFHALIDKGPVAEGAVIPSGTGIFHFTDPTLQLSAALGQHTITVVLGDNSHRRLRGAPIATVTFNVGAPSTPQGTRAQ